eukprot:6369970-Prymnesium_polylepis.1
MLLALRDVEHVAHRRDVYSLLVLVAHKRCELLGRPYAQAVAGPPILLLLVTRGWSGRGRVAAAAEPSEREKRNQGCGRHSIPVPGDE